MRDIYTLLLRCFYFASLVCDSVLARLTFITTVKRIPLKRAQSTLTTWDQPNFFKNSFCFQFTNLKLFCSI